MKSKRLQNPNPILFHESSTSCTNFTKLGSCKQSQIISSIAAMRSSFDCAANRARVSLAVVANEEEEAGCAGLSPGGSGAGKDW